MWTTRSRRWSWRRTRTGCPTRRSPSPGSGRRSTSSDARRSSSCHDDRRPRGRGAAGWRARSAAAADRSRRGRARHRRLVRGRSLARGRSRDRPRRGCRLPAAHRPLRPAAVAIDGLGRRRAGDAPRVLDAVAGDRAPLPRARLCREPAVRRDLRRRPPTTLPAASRAAARAAVSLVALIGLGRDIGSRFALVGLLPTGLLALFVLALVWSGAPGDAPDLDRVLDHARELDAWAGGLLFLSLVVLTLVLQPLQLVLVRWLEGYWPPALNRFADARRARFAARYEKLATASAPRTAPPTTHDLADMAQAAIDLRLLPPRDFL